MPGIYFREWEEQTKIHITHTCNDHRTSPLYSSIPSWCPFSKSIPFSTENERAVMVQEEEEKRGGRDIMSVIVHA